MMQPTFLPWQGYFGLIAASDTFVFLDDFQFSPQSWHQRNRLFLSKGVAGWYTVPVQTGGVFPLALNRAAVDPSTLWRDKMWKRLEQNYGKTPHFPAHSEALRDWLYSSPASLADFNIAFIRFVCDALDLHPEFRLSSEQASASVRSDRVLELLAWTQATEYYSARGSFDYMATDGVFPTADVDVLFEDFVPEAYQQAGSDGEFVPSLSVLDALLNVGPDETMRLIRAGTKPWSSWQDMHTERDGQDGHDV